MRAFADLLDRLSYTASRNAKLTLVRDYLGKTPDPDRGWALAALTGDLAFSAAKPAFIRKAVEARMDATLFRWSYDYVGDLAETVALVWPQRPGANREPELSEVVDALRGASRAEGPRVIEGWLEALPRRAGALPAGHAGPGDRRGGGFRQARSGGLCRRVEMGRHPHPGGQRGGGEAALQPHGRRHLGGLSRRGRGAGLRRRPGRRTARP